MHRRSEYFDVWHEVPLVPQLTGMSCWAAAAAMVVGWRDCIDIDPEAVARGSGRWEAYRDGLEPDDVDALAEAWGLSIESPQTYAVHALRELLEQNGPLWVGEASGGLHVVVVAGMHGDGDLDSTFVRILDPWPEGRGERYTISFRELASNLEAVSDIARVSARVLHASGRGGGSRSFHARREEHFAYDWQQAAHPERYPRARYGTPIALFEKIRDAPPGSFPLENRAGMTAIEAIPDAPRVPVNDAYDDDTSLYEPHARVVAYFDPGHGGRHDVGESTATGARGAGGTLEKEVSLSIAKRSQIHFGEGAMLSRRGDYNLSLRDRVDAARVSGAPAFVSIHANEGPPDRRGAEVWIYGGNGSRPDPGSLRLAEAIRGELQSLDGAPARVRAAEMAVLDPANHAPGVAACLVEVDYLSHPAGEARLAEPGARDRIGAAIARAVKQYLLLSPASLDAAHG